MSKESQHIEQPPTKQPEFFEFNDTMLQGKLPDQAGDRYTTYYQPLEIQIGDKILVCRHGENSLGIRDFIALGWKTTEPVIQKGGASTIKLQILSHEEREKVLPFIRKQYEEGGIRFL